MEKYESDQNFRREKILSYKPDFNPEILEIGLEKFQLKEYKSGDFILKAGQLCEQIYMVENSVTRCYFEDDHGEEKTMWLEPEKTPITDYESFSSQEISRCNICVYEDTFVHSINKDNLMMLYTTYHDWALFGLLVMESHYVNLLKIKNLISFNSARENYDYIEKHYARFFEVVPLKHLASWLNISPVHLSRIRKDKWKNIRN